MSLIDLQIWFLMLLNLMFFMDITSCCFTFAFSCYTNNQIDTIKSTFDVKSINKRLFTPASWASTLYCICCILSFQYSIDLKSPKSGEKSIFFIAAVSWNYFELNSSRFLVLWISKELCYMHVLYDRIIKINQIITKRATFRLFIFIS